MAMLVVLYQFSYCALQSTYELLCNAMQNIMPNQLQHSHECIYQTTK